MNVKESQKIATTFEALFTNRKEPTARTPADRYAHVASGASARGPFRGNPNLATRDHI